jgi:CheY-like chemotaxis protein
MPKKILIIDDDPIVLKYLESLLTDNGYEIVKAANGVEASDMVEKVKPDLITLDLEMPEQWGPRFYRRLTKNKLLKDIPVIVISGLSGSKYSIPKAAAHLNKPFDAEELLQLVRDHIGE